tara:strand:- start:976 stop:2052 length:1077 start_codon:yes stop_codon:yes gene_type:complete
MSSQAKILEVDATPVCPDDFVLPPHYAINKALAAIYNSQKIRGSDEHWLWGFAPAVAAGRLDLEDLSRNIESGPTSCATMTCERSTSRKAGKPAVDFTVTKLVPDRFRAHRANEGWGEQLEVVVVRKDEIHARKNYLEERSAVSGLSVCRHALERYYEREHHSHNDIHARILKDMADVDRKLGLAVAAGLFCNGDPFSPGAVTVLPLGEGLIIVRNTVIMAEKGWRPSSRAVRKKRVLLATPTDVDPCRSLKPFVVDGNPAEGFLMAMGVTYISNDIMRLEQRAYTSLFRAEAQKHDLALLGKDMGRTWLAHETKPPIPSIEVHPRLSYLLSQIVGAGRQWPLWYAMGWNRSDDPKAS